MHSVGIVCALLLAGTVTAAHAQTYPSRPIRYIVPQAPGGSSDTLARIVTQRVGDALGQQLVVDNQGAAQRTMKLIAPLFSTKQHEGSQSDTMFTANAHTS